MPPDEKKQSEVLGRLEQFLYEERHTKVTIAEKLDSTAKSLSHIWQQLNVHEAEDKGRHEQLMQAITGMGRRIEKLEDKEENTSNNEVAALHIQIREQRKTIATIVKTGLTAAGALALAAMGWIASWILTKGKP